MVGFGKIDKIVDAIHAGQAAQAEAITSLAEAVTALTQAFQGFVESHKIPTPSAPPAPSPTPQETWVMAETARLKRAGKPAGPDVVARLAERAVYLDTF